MRNLFFLLIITFSSISYADDIVYQLEQRINELTDKVERLSHENDLLQQKIDSLSEDVDFRIREIEKKSSTSANKTTTSTKNTKKTDPKLIKAQFDKAYDLLKKQKYTEAETALSKFISNYPKSDYTGNAYYWLGESLMTRKKYDKAAVNYLQSFNQFPKNSKADLSILKLSSALNALGKKKEACTMLAKLKPKNSSLSSTMQKLLKKELASNGCK
ncbi:MAG: tol-pal system protein YbgF [Rickettsiales bacterium]|jgi:tol-pal system protein YbgF|nr:tol-pal system protein YbgF [Rickettsiales bacterium]